MESRYLSAAERINADRTLQCAIKKAGRAAGTMVALGQDLTGPEADEELKAIVQRVESNLPDLQCHRLIISYSLLLLSTFKVCMSNCIKRSQCHIVYYTFVIYLCHLGTRCCKEIRIDGREDVGIFC